MLNKTIMLSEEDSLNMAKNLFRPSTEYIKEHHAILEEISNNIHVTETDNGFRVRATGLDLSFLNEVNSSKQISETFSVHLSTVVLPDDSSHSKVLDSFACGYNSAQKGGLGTCAA